MKTHVKNLKHAWVLLYMFVYFAWFFYLENRTNVDFTSISCKIDDFIPFNEIFVIPYILWFVYICVVVLYLLFVSKKEFYQCTAFLFTGMTICLFIYTIWPNSQDLRVQTFPRNNILTDLVNMFYTTDTPTNVCPSIHVYNSIGAHIAVWRCKSLKKNQFIRYGSLVLASLICLSTMFIKQHSFIDFACASLLAAVMYILVYKGSSFFDKNKVCL